VNVVGLPERTGLGEIASEVAEGTVVTMTSAEVDAVAAIVAPAVVPLPEIRNVVTPEL
jgi:hypothetical protein